ncbi:IclR family transcriptional regulator [Serinicoccus kebangsaanensis]|uniref:IclR family transcriptional regulator n=1 Tax=Serinicoccus kebangsaanensis TaxID=2602069 RepID=UPI00124F50C1|nr:helix-turn-helix domain-containing protein [Serinicoccus kebangsaanensis]
MAHLTVGADDRSTLGRLLAVIDLCLAAQTPVTLTHVVAETGLPKTTAWRIMRELTRRGLLDRTPEGRYTPGLRLVEIGNQAATRLSLQTVVTPELTDLHLRTGGAAVWVADVRNDDEWVIVNSIYNRRAAETRYVGTWQHSPRDPAVLASSLGILGMADRPGRAQTLIHRVPRLTPYTETNPGRVQKALVRAHEEHQVVEHEAFRLGWSCLAVPVVDRRSARTVAVVGVVERSPSFVPSKFLRLAHAAADSIGLQLAQTGER